jgi:hypothetical protein
MSLLRVILVAFALIAAAAPVIADDPPPCIDCDIR